MSLMQVKVKNSTLYYESLLKSDFAKIHFRNIFIRFEIIDNGGEELTFGFTLLCFVDLLFDLISCIFRWVYFYSFFSDFWEFLGVNEFPIQPLPRWDHFIVHIVGAFAGDGSTFELSNVLASITEEEMSFSLLLEVIYLSVVDFLIRILDFPIANDLVLVPLAWDYFARGKDERAFPVKFIAEAVPDVFVAVEELEMPFDFDSILIDASE